MSERIGVVGTRRRTLPDVFSEAYRAGARRCLTLRSVCGLELVPKRCEKCPEIRWALRGGFVNAAHIEPFVVVRYRVSEPDG